MPTPESSGWKEEIIKLIAMAISTLIALWLLINYSTLPVVILCVLGIFTVAWYADGLSKPKDSIPLRDKAVFITGCDTGFGRHLALSLAEQGVQVFAGCLQSQGEGATVLKNTASQLLHVVQCDVTNADEIAQAGEYVREHLQDKVLWGVVNNAGLNFDGDIEFTTMKYFELINNVNYLGMVRVTKQFIALIRHAKGRFVNITSVKGRVPTPFCAAYAATKYAGEAFSDVLRMEMKKFDVTVSVIEPGHYGGATGMIDMPRIRAQYADMWADLPDEARHVYGDSYVDAHVDLIQGESKTSSHEVSRVTDVIEHALFDLKPQSRYLIPGGSGLVDLFKIGVILKPYLPDSVMDWWLLRGTRSLPKPNVASRQT